MIKIALTGNIACGKSTVEKILQNKGFKVLDSDKITRELLKEGDVCCAFCDYDVFEDSKISRSKLGKLVFNNPELKQKLENILHPKIKEKILDFFDQNQSEEKVFVSVPLLFETGMNSLFDKIILIYADDSLRLDRLIARNGYSKEYAKLRMSCQDSQDEKIKKSDIVIYNNSGLNDLEQKITKLIG